MKLSKAQNTRYAFTIVEVLAVISIIALLAALVIGLQGRVKGKAEESRLLTEMAGIELALENYKAANGNYPPSNPWGSKAYPVADWSGAAGQDNQLYLHLVGLPTSQQKKPFLPDVKEERHQGNVLLASVTDGRVSGQSAKWYYNAYDPKYNKGSFDLWVEYGDWGEDGQQGTSDDIVKVISNWDK